MLGRFGSTMAQRLRDALRVVTYRGGPAHDPLDVLALLFVLVHNAPFGGRPDRMSVRPRATSVVAK